MTKATKYLYIYGGHIVTGDGFFSPLAMFSKIPKVAEIDFCRKIIYEIFDHFFLSDFISKLSWLDGLSSDSIYNFFPIVNWNYIPNDILYDQKDQLLGEMIQILCNKWHKDVSG